MTHAQMLEALTRELVRMEIRMESQNPEMVLGMAMARRVMERMYENAALKGENMSFMMDLCVIVAVYIVGAVALVTVGLLTYHAISDWFKGLDDIPKSDDHGQAD